MLILIVLMAEILMFSRLLLVIILLILLHFAQIVGSILFGAGCSGVRVSLKVHSERGPHDEPVSSAENWSVFSDGALAPQAEKLVHHLAR